MTETAPEPQTRRDGKARERAFQLSHQQRRAWQLSGGTPESVGCAITAQGPGAAAALRRGLEAVVRRHGVLRTVFRSPPGVRLPLQWVQEEGGVAWSPGEGAPAAAPRVWLREELAADLEVDAAPTLRARLGSDGNGTAVLALALPSLAADAWTLARLPGEIAATLGSGEAGEPVQYPAFAAWQDELLEGQDEDAMEGRAFWTTIGAGLPPEPVRPPGRPEPPHRVAVPVDPEVLRSLDDRDRAQGRSPGAGLRAAWHLLTARLAGEGESIVGTVLDGRGDADLEDLLGPVERRVPLRLEVDPRLPWESLASQAAESLEQAREWEDFALAEVVGLPAAFAFGYRHLPALPTATAGDLRLELVDLEPGLTGAACELVRNGDGALEIRLDPARHGVEEGEVLAARLARVLEHAATGGDRPADEAPVDLPGESEGTLHHLDAVAEITAVPDPVVAFVGWARKDPERPAVSGGGGSGSLSYGELEDRSAALAHRLRAAGAGAEKVVAIWGDPRPDLLVAVLGVLRSGAAYLPLDPATPTERLRRMLEGLPVVAVVEVGEDAAFPVAGVPRVAVAEASAGAGSGASLPASDPGSLAYLIFTSGSTGRPKPVGVERRQLGHYVAGLERRVAGAGGLVWGLVSSFAADLGHTALFPPLAGGGRVHLVSREASRDPDAFAREMATGEVEALKVVPSHLEALMVAAEPRRVLPRRLLVLGGEAWPSGLLAAVRRAAPELAVWNHYGPTETTVGATVQPVADVATGTDSTAGTVPIGAPLPGVRTLPLDDRLRIVPPGVPGELWIGGGGVARGYLGRPAITAERFRPDPWGDGDRLYRTGDRVRQHPAGPLEFLGRRDHQVKVRGHRVELGEVESVMAEHPGVAAAAAVVRPGPSGALQLEGFYVPRQDDPGVDELRSFLGGHLPDALVPTRLGTLDALPRTAAGKVDRNALPDLAAEEGERTWVPPSGPVEEALAEIWSEVLGVDRVGAEDNFFALGGDSILVVQVIARAAAAGIGLTPRQFFEAQTVSGLARVAGTAGAADASGAGPGPVPLLPAQRRFLEGRRRLPRRWNWTVLLEPLEPLDPARVGRSARSMVARHDALRLRFFHGVEGWRQELDPAPPPEGHSGEAAAAPHPFSRVDLGALPPDRRRAALEMAADAAQELDPVHGGLLRVVLFELGGAAQRLLLVAHHLVVDGVSWRILLEELVVETTGSGDLPPSTTPFARWARKLVEQVREGALDDEVDHWLTLTDVPSLPEGEGEDRDSAREDRLAEALDPETTAALLQEVPSTYRLGMDEILAAALALAVAEVWDRDRVLVEWEGHGREELVPEADLTRTVGWFTSYYPVVLEVSSGDDVGAVLRSAKESLRRVPRRGAGLGPLRDFTIDDPLRRRLAALPRPELKLNYLGQVDRVLPEDLPFRAAGESAGRVRGGASPRSRSLELVARVAGGRLHLVLRHDSSRFRRAAAAALVKACCGALHRILDHCRRRDAPVATPSDFPLAGDLDQEQLERILRRASGSGGARKETSS